MTILLAKENKCVYGFHAVKQLLQHSNNAGIEHICLLQGRRDLRSQEIIAVLKKHRISYEFCARSVLDQLAGSAKHQGFVAVIAANDDVEVAPSNRQTDDLAAFIKEIAAEAFLLVLDGVQDPHNLGACLRSANAAGVHAVIIPKDNAVGLTETVRKVSCGAAESTPLFVVTNLARTLRMLKENGIWLYGMAAEAEHSIYDVKLEPPLALVMGAEGNGLRRLTRQLCDYLINIPMFGNVESLNVSVATGIVLFEYVRSWRRKQ